MFALTLILSLRERKSQKELSRLCCLRERARSWHSFEARKRDETILCFFFAWDDNVPHHELISRLDSFSISRVLKFLGKYREAGLLLLRASVGLIFILICAPVLLSGEHRWWQFGSAMRVFNFHSHLDWWGFLGALAGCVGGIFMMLGFAFRIGILLAFLVALVNAIAVAHHEHGLYSIIIPIEAVIILVCLSFIGPGKYSVDKG
jgi:putative oxidoreductase